MPAPSEAFKWILFPGIRKVCRQCGREPLRVQDVGEHRCLYPSRKTEFLCKQCQRENIEQAVDKRRHELGLSTRST